MVVKRGEAACSFPFFFYISPTFNSNLTLMVNFDVKNLVTFLEDKGWATSYSLDARSYWNCVWEAPGLVYVIEVPVWPHTKLTFLKHKVRGYVVDQSTGEVFTMPSFEFDLKAEAYMTYHYLRIWIAALMEKK